MSDRCENKNYRALVSGLRCERAAKFEVESFRGTWLKVCAHHAVRFKKCGCAYRVLPADSAGENR